APDAVLLDVRLRGSSGLDLCGQILAVQPGCKVVFLTVYDDEQYLYQALRVGIPAEADPRQRAGGLPGPDPRRRGSHRPDPGWPGRAVRRPAAQRGVLARRASRPHPAGERGALAAGRRALQPGDRRPAGGRGRDREDPFPRHIPQARGLRPRRRRRGGAARGCVPLTGARLDGVDAEREAQLLSRVIDTISGGLDLGRMLQGVARLVTEATATDVCFVHLLDERGRTLRLQGATPPFDILVGKIELGLGEGVSGWVASHGQPAVIVDDKTADPRYLYIPALRGEEFTSMASVPIVTPLGHLVGVLNVHTRLRREFTAADTELLRSVAGLVAGAIENARLHLRLAEREEALEQFAERTVEWQEHERRRLAGEIHDGISQRIVSLFFHLSAAADAIPDDPEIAAEQV